LSRICFGFVLDCFGFVLGKIAWEEGMLSELKWRVRKCKGLQNRAILFNLNRKNTLPIAV
jgi:hypothetical protein